MGSQETARGREYRSLAIALYGAAFKHKVQMVLVGALHQTLVVEVAIDLIVKCSLKFLAPTVELKI